MNVADIEKIANSTQAERVLWYIREHGSITQIEALNKLGVMRLASRVSDLRRQGFKITGKMVTVKNRWGEDCHVKQYSEGATDNG